tara:strand:+ start:506 stop:967 length:462 start_codon:yes stop_codon:yes gene_type:complete
VIELVKDAWGRLQASSLKEPEIPKRVSKREAMEVLGLDMVSISVARQVQMSNPIDWAMDRLKLTPEQLKSMKAPVPEIDGSFRQFCSEMYEHYRRTYDPKFKDQTAEHYSLVVYHLARGMDTTNDGIAIRQLVKYSYCNWWLRKQKEDDKKDH